MLLLLLLTCMPTWAQITDASFFPSVRSINPGVSHMRQDGFLALDLAKKNNEKKHDVPLGGIVGGINTDVDLTKGSFFAAGRGGKFMNAELLIDQESGTRTESIKNPVRGDRKTTDDASSKYFGGIVDFRYFGISYAGADFNYLNKFRVGVAPDLTARDEKKELKYTNLKIGSAIKIRALRVGVYILNQKATGDFTYTFYDPSTGNKGDEESFGVSSSAKGYGAGLGFTLPKFRSELSLEKMYDTKLNVPDDYPRDVNKPDSSSRMTFVAETKISFISLGFRFRRIQGNYADLEDIISSNLLYDGMKSDDVRNETSFNFSFGSSKGFSPSAFYTVSELKIKELSPVFDNGLKYKSVTKSKAYGINLSYRF